MNSKRFAELASQAQAGDKASLEQLLLLAYTPVSYQCRKLLQNNQAAEAMTKEVLKRIPSRLNTLNNPELFENWLSNLTAKHCMQELRQPPAEKNAPPKKLHVPGEQLDERETAMVVDQIVDALPDDLRICITLYCCKIPVNAITRLTGFAESAVTAHLSRAQALINGQLQKLSQRGIRFAAVASLPELLQIAMYTPKNPKAASAMVNSILGKRAAAVPVPKQQKKKTVPALKIAVAVVSVLLVLMLGLIFFLERNRRTELEAETTTVATEATTMPTETTISTTTSETTAETTMETTVETTVETTAETTEETTEATTEPATEPAPQAQQAQGSQSVSNGGSTSSAAGGNTSSGTGGNTSSAAGGNHVHSYQDAGPIGVVSAGCESPGSRLKICFVCGDQVRYTDATGLPALGHSYSTSVKAPTTSREGYTVHTCTRCGLTYMDNYVPKLPEETQPPVTQAPPAPQPEAEPEMAPEN